MIRRKAIPIFLSILTLAFAISINGCGGRSESDDDSCIDDNTIIAFYNFDEESGADIFDLSGNELHGVLQGASRAEGKVGSALTIENQKGKAEIFFQSYDFSLDSGQISIEAWVRLDQLDVNKTYHLIGNTSGGLQTFRFQINEGKLEFLVAQDGWQRVILGMQVLSVDTWHHVAVTFSGSEAITYIDGIEDNSRSIGYKIVDIYNIITIGNSSYTDDFNGQIDEVKIYDTLRTADQISETYQDEYQGISSSSCISPPYAPVEGQGLVLYYNFDEESGADIFDLSGNELHGVLQGASRAEGKVGSALTIENQKGKAEIFFQSYDFSLDSGQISIEAWVRLDQLDVNKTYHLIGNTSGGLQTFRFQINEGKLDFLVAQDGWQRVILGMQVLSVDTWHHVAVTFSGSEAITYIDGIEDNSRSIGYKIVDIYNIITIGNSSYTDDFNGQIDEVKIYDIVRTLASSNTSVIYGGFK